MQNFAKNGLYLVSKPDGVNFEILEQLFAAKSVNIFQLRLKNCSEQFVLETATKAKFICDKYSVPLIINDNYKLFTQINAHGLHVGSGDENEGNIILTPQFLQHQRQSGKIIGVSCYNNLEKALQYAAMGVSYVSFGAFFKTSTKVPPAKAKQTIITNYKLQNQICPCVGIGGLTHRNISRLVKQGLNYAAVVGGLWNLPNLKAILKTARRINGKFD